MRYPAFAACGLALAALISTPAIAQVQQGNRLSYPPSDKGAVVDDYHGTTIADPYRWMESLESAETAAWVTAQNAVTFRYLESLPLREAFKARITELWNYPKVGIPYREAGLLWYRKNSGLQRQSPFYSRQSIDGPATLVMDPNTMSADGSLQLAALVPSPDGKLLAYSTAEGGADWQVVRVRDLATGKDLGDEVRWMRFSGLSWTKDGKGFFYSRFPEPPKGKVLEAALGVHELYYHRVGTPQSEDRLIMKGEGVNWFVGASVSEDGRYAFVSSSYGTDQSNKLWFADLGDAMHPNVGAPLAAIQDTAVAELSPLGNVGSVVYARTDLDAPRRRIVAIDLRNPAKGAWRTVVPESENVIEGSGLVGGKLVLHYLEHVQSRLRLFGLGGESLGQIELPGIGTVAGFSGREDRPELFYSFTSPLYPSTVFAYDLNTGKTAPFEPATPTGFDPALYETKQFFAVSKDGTKVPYFVTARKGMALDGHNPTILYGYGGFSISTTASFSPGVAAWLEKGGVYATANMRGGAEYGEAWHQAGMLEKKQNVFDDFIAVAEDLVTRGYASPKTLGIYGGSNGGLLVGAVANQRPDLFAVAMPAVGVMDMLRYDRFTGGAAWVPEYGASSDPKMFPVLLKYSPLHNIKPGTCYPATLVTTADHDDRVVPSHSFKYAATLQAAQSCDRPVLIRVETQGSHGYVPTDKQIQRTADLWAFAGANMGMK
ncbi:MAG: prolyl oligopeptidase family serine peptidase [Gemmatimonadaceae bacterium]